jgi:adenosine kinase
MTEAADIELAPVVARVGEPDLVVVGPNDPTAMVRHTQECRQRGYAFAADPSQQLAWADGAMIRSLVEGADLLFTNEYEAALLAQKTGWTAEQVLERVGTWVTTRSAEGVLVRRAGEPPLQVKAVPETKPVEPTGGGDALRAGFIAGRVWGLSLERSAQLGSAVATEAVEVVGTQEYRLEREPFLARFAEAFGAEAAAEVAPHLP